MTWITEMMIWYLFLRVCLSDFKAYADRKIRQTIGLE